MNWIRFASAAVVAGCVQATMAQVATPADATPATPGKPNVLLILVDDMGWNALSCYGNTAVATPNLDKLAASGIRFTHAYAEPQCSPTRASLLTGQWTARNGMTSVTHEKNLKHAYMLPPEPVRALPLDAFTLGEMFKSAGYRTGIAGKWHVGGNYSAAPQKKDAGQAYFDAFGFDEVSDVSENTAKADKAVDALTDEAIGFVKKHRGEHFFYYLAHFTPHSPMAAPKDLVQKLVGEGFRKSTNAICDFNERPTADYYAMLIHLDDSVGRLMSALDETGLRENTLVIFASDNGGMTRMAAMDPLSEGKGSLHEGGVRVPMIFSLPGVVPQGRTLDTRIHFVDYFPTFATLVGATLPNDLKLDGVDISPLLKGTGDLAPRPIAFHAPSYTPMYGRAPCSSIIDGDFKLIHYFGDYIDTTGAIPENNKPCGKLIVGERYELFDLKNDTSEMTNLADAQPERVKMLRAKLDAWRKETGARLPTVNPNYTPDNWADAKD